MARQIREAEKEARGPAHRAPSACKSNLRRRLKIATRGAQPWPTSGRARPMTDEPEIDNEPKIDGETANGSGSPAEQERASLQREVDVLRGQQFARENGLDNFPLLKATDGDFDQTTARKLAEVIDELFEADRPRDRRRLDRRGRAARDADRLQRRKIRRLITAFQLRKAGRGAAAKRRGAVLIRVGQQ